jgi:hypothetical protein
MNVPAESVRVESPDGRSVICAPGIGSLEPARTTVPEMDALPEGGPGATGGPVRSLPLTESDLLESEVETSRDAALVGATGEALIRETSLLNAHGVAQQEVAASEAFGKRLLSRARELDPGNPRWRD